ncbi:enoyl-CoA hydratase/isomerase family protein [Rhizobium sp. BK251]|uniref:enoyl-CoA hydratase/isomerase family protein n=1 Tax=Rhizobium sp. BK251 TaxID=2512125 RepID=UPI001051656F|nr:enoyl-CoA hydratase/isomerase family protein [Rhizobium sp. BK251]TCL64694.1 enoyl-CoA hydratase/carnithine racemase [Rhizobium sp. BK251]
MSFVDLQFKNTIATVTLNHPGGNRINFQMREEILAAFEKVASSKARVLLVKGSGPDFCLGGDIRDWPDIGASDLRPRVEVYARAIDLLEQLPIPTIAVVQGGCMGGGFELALGCDLIVAGTSAHFMFPEAFLGIMTLQGGVYQLAERIGRNKAIEMVFLSEVVDAAQMANWNVVNWLVDDGDLEKTADELAERLRLGPADAYRRTKQLMQIWRQQGRAAARAALYDVSMPLFDTPAVQSALRSAVKAVKAGDPIPKAAFPDN